MAVANAVFGALLEVINMILSLYIWVLVIGAILSWLVAFNVINSYNRLVQMTSDFIYRLTEPFLRPIRRILPPVGGLDLSPLILIFIIYFVQLTIRNLMFQHVVSAYH